MLESADAMVLEFTLARTRTHYQHLALFACAVAAGFLLPGPEAIGSTFSIVQWTAVGLCAVLALHSARRLLGLRRHGPIAVAMLTAGGITAVRGLPRNYRPPSGKSFRFVEVVTRDGASSPLSLDPGGIESLIIAIRKPSPDAAFDLPGMTAAAPATPVDPAAAPPDPPLVGAAANQVIDAVLASTRRYYVNQLLVGGLLSVMFAFRLKIEVRWPDVLILAVNALVIGSALNKWLRVRPTSPQVHALRAPDRIASVRGWPTTFKPPVGKYPPVLDLVAVDGRTFALRPPVHLVPTCVAAIRALSPGAVIDVANVGD